MDLTYLDRQFNGRIIAWARVGNTIITPKNFKMKDPISRLSANIET